MTVRQLRDMLHALPTDADHVDVYLDPDGREFAEAWEVTFVPVDNAAGDEPKVVIADSRDRRCSRVPILITLPRWGG